MAFSTRGVQRCSLPQLSSPTPTITDRLLTWAVVKRLKFLDISVASPVFLTLVGNVSVFLGPSVL